MFLRLPGHYGHRHERGDGNQSMVHVPSSSLAYPANRNACARTDEYPETPEM
jgi:hypothetical protein